MDVLQKTQHIEQILLSHVNMIYDVALEFVGDYDMAELLARRTFHKALGPAASVPDPDHVKSWLLKVLRDTFLEEFAEKDGRDTRYAVVAKRTVEQGVI